MRNAETAGKLVVEPPVTVSRGFFCLAASHDKSDASPFTALELSAVNPWLVRLVEESDCIADPCFVASYAPPFTALELSPVKPWSVKPAKE